MEVKATAKYIRISPRKVRLVVNAIKGLSPQKALTYLKFIKKRAAQPLAKVIKSALSNAKTNHNLQPEKLKFKKIEVTEGPTLKRWRPISRGRAHKINKRTSHIKVVLEGEEEVKKSQKGGQNGTKS